MLVTDDTRLPDPAAAIKALPENSAVLFRHYGDPDRADHLNTWATLARECGHRVWIAKDVDLAMRLNADLLHLPEALMDQATDIKTRYPHQAISVATHSTSAILQAATLPVDAVVISPVFATQSHPGTGPLGPSIADTMAQRATGAGLVPYALGGITDATAPLLANSRFAGLAAIGALR